VNADRNDTAQHCSELFLESDYEVTALPSYERASAGEPVRGLSGLPAGDGQAQREQACSRVLPFGIG
jgi:hypothetical protein